MALFIGGPADGWRIEVDPKRITVEIAINPHAPAFTTDSVVLSAVAKPIFKYKQEHLACGQETYPVFVPHDWCCNDLIEALILHYRPPADPLIRQQYIREAEGTLYDNDDRIQDGRPYRI